MSPCFGTKLFLYGFPATAAEDIDETVLSTSADTLQIKY